MKSIYEEATKSSLEIKRKIDVCLKKASAKHRYGLAIWLRWTATELKNFVDNFGTDFRFNDPDMDKLYESIIELATSAKLFGYWKSENGKNMTVYDWSDSDLEDWATLVKGYFLENSAVEG